jgi:hypothetical protein
MEIGKPEHEIIAVPETTPQEVPVEEPAPEVPVEEPAPA